jgi:hypothetical protein
LTKKSGRSVTVEVSSRATAEVPEWEDRVILNLAKAALQNNARDKETFQRIAERARLLTHVPENRWADVEWFDEE